MGVWILFLRSKQSVGFFIYYGIIPWVLVLHSTVFNFCLTVGGTGTDFQESKNIWRFFKVPKKGDLGLQIWIPVQCLFRMLVSVDPELDLDVGSQI